MGRGHHHAAAQVDVDRPGAPLKSGEDAAAPRHLLAKGCTSEHGRGVNGGG
eukprot:CAMPEP_0179915272 /NCGR_PEP_ID=MMETSP0983-20121128/1572_1 /TAXON_ID=483367 /ORGANISM="non described non described, Strain CCMP 2436" /LENGTH=50 /DNA_ID=CAMNT_0021817651 /DNA_START=161 /DNA_END=309 /DNA_ORIENTATION=+